MVKVTSCTRSSAESVKLNALTQRASRLEGDGQMKGVLTELVYMFPQTFTVTSNISAFTFQFFCFTIFSCRLRAVD